MSDLISREALKKVITSNHYLLSAKNNSTDYGMFTTGIMQAIDNAPTLVAENATSDRPQGEWKHNNFDEHYCNKCGYPALYSEEPDGYYEVQSNFCPNCGANLKGEEE